MHYVLSRLLSNHKDLHEWDTDTEGEMIPMNTRPSIVVSNDSDLQLPRGVMAILSSKVSPVN